MNIYISPLSRQGQSETAATFSSSVLNVKPAGDAGSYVKVLLPVPWLSGPAWRTGFPAAPYENVQTGAGAPVPILSASGHRRADHAAERIQHVHGAASRPRLVVQVDRFRDELAGGVIQNVPTRWPDN
ncbi:MAG: hypothetical protein HY000_27375 [Planctomycetes bacterium]|nr:hypothetical protein [Planctomycetota bacterium]